MSFNLERMILAEAIKAGHIRLKDLTQSQDFTEIPKHEEEKLLTEMLMNGEFTVDSLQSKGLLSQEKIDVLMALICENENINQTFGRYTDLGPAGNGAMA